MVGSRGNGSPEGEPLASAATIVSYIRRWQC